MVLSTFSFMSFTISSIVFKVAARFVFLLHRLSFYVNASKVRKIIPGISKGWQRLHKYLIIFNVIWQKFLRISNTDVHENGFQQQPFPLGKIFFSIFQCRSCVCSMVRKVDINLITGTFTTFFRTMRSFGRFVLFFSLWLQLDYDL